MRLEKFNKVILASAISLACGGQAYAQSNDSIVFDNVDGNLVEMEGGETVLVYSSASLPGSCPTVDVITEQFTDQPASNIVGVWQTQEEEGFYLEIANSGQIDIFEVEDGECYGFNIGELNGNSLSYSEDAIEMGDSDSDESDFPSAIKLSLLDDRLITNSVYVEQDGTEGSVEFVEAALLSQTTLPVECDVMSAFPVAETFNDNPDSALVADWLSEEPVVYFEMEDDLEEDEDIDDSDEGDDSEDEDDESEDGDDDSEAGDDESEDGDDDSEDGEDESEDGDDDSEDGDDESEDGDDDSEDGDDDSEDGDDESEDGDDESEDGDDESEDGDDESEEAEENDSAMNFFSVSPSGYLVQSRYTTNEAGIATCSVAYIGELNGDTFKAADNN